ncbi:MAG: hypothetical protein H7332_04245, partial [Bdellovibrionales bacterium]|nr:hypothetical protein [Ramlibacter sp.]
MSFSTFLKKSYAFLTGKSDSRPAELDAQALKTPSSIVEPIAKDNGSQSNIGTVNGNVYFITSQEANQAQNAVARLLRDETTTSTRLHHQVLLYWYQVKNAKNSATGDRGIIESIADYPVKVICAHDSLKIEMILDRKNPFKSAYIVDVGVETLNGKPAV